MAFCMNERFNQRLKQLREEHRLSQRELAKELKINVTPVAISQWETGITEPKMSNLKALADFFKVDIEWLNSGKTKATEIDRTDPRILHIAPIQLDTVKKPINQFIALSEDLIYETQNVGWFEVEGNSMSPLIPNGSTVIVDRGNLTIKDDSLYLLDIGEGLRVKQISQTLSGYVVRSFNEQYPDELFETQAFTQKFKVLGRVIRIISKV